ncbi:MAG: BNR repeat-containing protein [Candidatus Hydrogenedentes bacterium]|nr:BNR repeat-containing protein [Candidatus Hydrogenedentota bacterium]
MIDIAPVWAGHKVGFALLTQPPHQYVAYYDNQRRMTVAMRALDKTECSFQVLPETVGWDSHNYIAMAIDSTGSLHLSGNMHVTPLKYFQTANAHDIASFTRVEKLIGSEESRVTYPSFITGPAGQFIFTYREGSSGNGNQIYDVYDPISKQWSRLLDKPLVDGEGKRNAYFNGPSRGPDGYFHLCWVWREDPDCATNHDLSYARSKDLVHWESSQGKALQLPITLSAGEIVDPVPVHGGIINGNAKTGFDTQHRPVIAYHKFDAAGNTQLYNARLEESGWRIYQCSNWDYRWDFGGGGSIDFEIRVQPVSVDEHGNLIQGWEHKKYGSQRWRIDPNTLQPIERVRTTGHQLPASLGKPQSNFPGMLVQFASDSGATNEPGIEYRLRWETLGHNRDKPRPEPWPEPSILQVIKIYK